MQPSVAISRDAFPGHLFSLLHPDGVEAKLFSADAFLNSAIMKREIGLSDQGKPSRPEIVVIMVFLIGTALIIAGQSVYRYATQTISNLEARLSLAGLSQNEYWAVEGSLNWWRQALVSVYGPVSIYLVTAGIATLAFLIAYFALTILRRNKHESASRAL